MANKEVDIFQNTIIEQMLGPGSESDIYYPDIESEIIANYPLVRYFTGVIFPEKSIASQGELDTDSFDSDSEVDIDDLDENDDIETNISDDLREDSKPETLLSNHFFPTNIGLTFCLDKEKQNVESEFSFSIYEQVKSTDIKLKTSDQIYQVLTGDEYGFPFKNILNYEESDSGVGRLSLKRNLDGKLVGYTEEFGLLKDWYQSADDEIKQTIFPAYKHIKKIVSSGLWQRRSFKVKINIDLNKDTFPPKQFDDFSNAGYTSKIIEKNGYKFVKLQLVNLFPALGVDTYSNTKEILNKSCLFQSSIKVKCDEFRPYKPYLKNKESYDNERDTLDFLYRDLNHYSIGHNCSTEWLPIDKPSEINTSFIPTYDLKSTKTNIENIVDISLFDLSIWNKNKSELFEKLNSFVNSYDQWIISQKEFDKFEIPNDLIENLDITLQRLKEGISLLETNEDLFRCFQVANTAMLIQFSLTGDFYKNLQSIQDLSQKPENVSEKIQLRPFQLAFLLISLESIINPESKYRSDYVDLIWFPTGGGKTEAYLAVAALTIVWRRFNNINYSGVSVIMRYTLRLLTAQQFERAGKLITVLEFLRQKFPNVLKDEPITIGLWIGGDSTPNKLEDSIKIVKNISNDGDSSNQFQIDKCPWCSGNLIQQEGVKYKQAFEVRERKKELKIRCLNSECHFSSSKNSVPVKVVDETLYFQPPTLLFGTVDKFAMLSWVEDGHKFFNSLDDKAIPPDLIIQDELHLLTGPLGSIVGLFETIIEELCSKGNLRPKIIASTATTRNTSEQVKNLFGNRSVSIFPPPGISYNDSFFSKESEDSNRKYLGFMPTGKTSVDSQVNMMKTLLLARLRVFENELDIDPYWTLVSYYNSLKDVGRMSNKVGDELKQLLRVVQIRLQHPSSNNFNFYGLFDRTEELTSRIKSSKIKNTLARLERNFELNKQESGLSNVSSEVIDLTLATNMLSVGIDINRLNIMQINGIPRDTAEYIQASSRVGRKDKGLVVSIFDANKARDKSYYEHFVSFHQSLYKSIEPLSITPFTENTIKKMITSLFVSYLRNIKGLSKNDSIKYFDFEMAEDLISLIEKRFKNFESIEFCKDRIYELANDLREKISQENPYRFFSNNTEAILNKPNQSIDSENIWTTMQSMRDVDTNSWIQIELSNE